MPAPYLWNFISITYGFNCLEYWRAQCDAPGCERLVEADWKIDPRRITAIRPLCEYHKP